MDVERTVGKKGKHTTRHVFKRAYCVPSDYHWNNICTDPTQYAPLVAYCVCRVHKMLQWSILCMQGTQYATKRSILCRGAFCGPTVHALTAHAHRVWVYQSHWISKERDKYQILMSEVRKKHVKLTHISLSVLFYVAHANSRDTDQMAPLNEASDQDLRSLLTEYPVKIW